MRVRPSQTPRWQLSELAGLVGASTSGEAVVTGIALNTAHLVAGDLYVALPGANAHGATYVEQARERGAAAVLTDEPGAALVGDVLPVVVVDAPRRRLAGLSASFYGHPAESFQTLGITGTQGKTTTTYLAEAALGERVSAVVGTIGTRIGKVPAASTLTTPEAPQLQALFAVMREEAVELCAMEVSSHALVQGRVDGFVFDAAVFLNLGRDHLDFHHDLEDYFLAKAALFTPERARHAVVNVDDAHGRRLRELTPLPVTTFSTGGNPADWRGVNIRPHRLGTDLEVLGPDGLALDLSVPLPGAFNVSNALAVVAALATMGHDPAVLAEGIAASTGVPGRMERVPTPSPRC
jgi:UDP-N-acetylmuramoyl-L-alanyl-D-glutamate--2,6-diaminopimelate ligase